MVDTHSNFIHNLNNSFVAEGSILKSRLVFYLSFLLDSFSLNENLMLSMTVMLMTLKIILLFLYLTEHVSVCISNFLHDSI